MTKIINGVASEFEFPSDIGVFTQLEETQNCLKDLLKENQELKKQLEEQIATNEVLSHELTKDKILKQDHLTTCCDIPIGNIPKLITQQKEFIKYLQEELNAQIQEESIGCEITNKRYILEEILQKYKEIVGVLDDKESKEN